MQRVRAVSLDVTGTMLVHKAGVYASYAAAAKWAGMPAAPTAEEFKPAFKKAYKDTLAKYPCYGHGEGMSSKQWWRIAVGAALDNTINNVGNAAVGAGEACLHNKAGHADFNETKKHPRTEADFERFFRRIYQHYGSPEGYSILPDVVPFLEYCKARGIPLGVTTNTPTRTIDTVLPLIGLHDYFKWFVCSQDAGAEKPDASIFNQSLELAQYWVPDLKPEEILHIGDSPEADLCGAKAAGFQALVLDRTSDPRVSKYQDWLVGPHYVGKSEADIQQCTINSLQDAAARLDAAYVATDRIARPFIQT